MAYYLTVSRKKGEYTPLDITKSKYFTRNSRYRNMGVSLPEMDLFTMMFNNEAEMRKCLYEEGILKYEDINRPLSARNLKNGKYHKVMYDFLYQKDIEYVLDPKKVIRRVIDKYVNDDYRFMKQYAHNFVDFYDCGATAAELRMFADNSIFYENQDKHLNDPDENGDALIVRMTKLLIYEYYVTPNGDTVYKDKIKYRNLHSVIAFINNYDKKYANEEIDDYEQESLFDQKKKVLKKDEQVISGEQISMFE